MTSGTRPTPPRPSPPTRRLPAPRRDPPHRRQGPRPIGCVRGTGNARGSDAGPLPSVGERPVRDYQDQTKRRKGGDRERHPAAPTGVAPFSRSRPLPLPPPRPSRANATCHPPERRATSCPWTQSPAPTPDLPLAGGTSRKWKWASLASLGLAQTNRLSFIIM